MSLDPDWKKTPKKFGREKIYNELTVQFFGITRELSEEKKTELDGLLWDVALRLVEV